MFTTAAEAALAYARYIGQKGCAVAMAPPPAPAPVMTEEEARRLAEAEGLQLVASDNATGFKGVHFLGESKHAPFRAEIRQGGRQHNLGTFTGPAEAALAYARRIGPAACAAASAPAGSGEVTESTSLASSRLTA